VKIFSIVKNLPGLREVIQFVMLSVIVAVIYSFVVEEKYTATLKFLPSEEESGIGGAAAAMGSLGGLAASLGVSLGGQSNE